MEGRKDATARPESPAPSLPFWAGIKANGFIFTAGQVGTDPRTGQVVGYDVASQTRQTIANLQAVLAAGGSSLDCPVKTTRVFADLRTLLTINQVFKKLMPQSRTR